MIRRAGTLLAGCLAAACGGELAPSASGDAGAAVDASFATVRGVTVRMDFASEAFLDAPFPTEDRRQADGRIAIADFPDPSGLALVGGAKAVLAASADGFGRTSGVFMRLDAADGAGPASLSAAGLPDLAGSVRPEAGVFLAELGVDGVVRRVPASVAFEADGGPHGTPGMLSIVPLQGISLRPGALHAAVVLRALGDADGAPLGVSPQMAALAAGVRPAGLSEAAFGEAQAALEALEASGVARGDVAGLAFFRTGSPEAELSRVVAHARAADLVAVTTPARVTEVFDAFCVLSGELTLPDYQAGSPPFTDAGGGWTFDADGAPILQRRAPSRLVLTIPRAPMPASGYPLTLFVRTGGGGDRPLVDRGVRGVEGGPALDPGSGPALHFASVGVAGASWDGPHGGPRNVSGGDEQFLMFNFLNPEALRDNVRQTALEAALVIDLVTGRGFAVPAAGCPGAGPGGLGGEIRFDAARVALMGHSMGATVAPVAAAVAPQVGALLLSGAGGSFLENVLWKRRPLDVRPLAEALLGYSDLGRSLSRHDPVLSLVQWAGEAADPPIYAEALAGRHVLMMQGIVDSYIMPPIANALSLALRLDLAGPALDAGDPRLAEVTPLAAVLGFAGGEAMPLPVAGNRFHHDHSVTAVVTQHPQDAIEDGHEAVFQTGPPRHQYRCFLRDFSLGRTPRVITGAEALDPCPEAP